MKGHLGFVCRRIFGPPSEPLNVTVTAEENTVPTYSSAGLADITVSWSPPAYAGSGITSYTVTVTDVGTVVVAGGVTSHTFTGAVWGSEICQSWPASVTATNAAGSGPAAHATSGVFPETTEPLLLDVEAEPVYGSGDTLFSLRWLPVCVGNGGLTANGSPVSDEFTHYELQAIDVGGAIAGADGSGSYYGWRFPSASSVSPALPTNPDNGVPLAGWPKSVKAVTFTSNANYYTPFSTGLRFRVRTIRIVNYATVAVGTWSNIEEASWL